VNARPTYHVDIHRHLPGFAVAKARLIRAPYPVWSMSGVSGLAGPGMLVEIRATAIYHAS
jgi:enamine deaminase RidA (YjgF/YER057c/UK114 family)